MPIMNDKILSLCGLAKCAGKVTVGTNMVTSFIRGKVKPQLVILSSDASDNSKKKISDSCEYHNVKLIFSDYTMIELGHAIGQSGGAACIAVADAGFSKAILNHYETKETANSKDSQEVK